ncbi:MFS transporter [Metabacillus sediminilitoris]|uniref:MFS transporter n=1 Tax=Metabacillus sediminilitoris TaxID=2567941 RepID=A0A4S4BS64_9BACI|nr:glycoside-pentoside-hexuronide (GPH):cation symporter [Metabacillus sediminilitoris]QGQ48479.1 MFS transporter [Metabacillus sediminilitoris]THF77868.1 MFS transporter [Metabacillus sediminilitoris]
MGQGANVKVTDSITPNTQVRKFGMRDKLGYMFGDFGNDFFFILVANFLMVYYTDIYGVSAAFVGVLFLVARLWDAVADVTWGRFIDTRKPTKNGKFKPWIFRMSFPLVISGVLMFVHIPGMSNGFYEAYAFVTYILWGTLYSTVNIPYGSMASVITNDPVERTTLSTFRTMGAMLASLIISAGGPLIIFKDNKADADGFLMAAIIFGILSIACYMACYKLSTERIVMPERPKTEQKGGTSRTMKGLLKNRPLMTILIASLLFMMCTMLVGAVNVYLFKDYFSNTAALSIVGIIQTVTVFIAIPLIKPLVTKFGKKEVAAVGMLLAGIMYILLFILPGLSTNLFIGLVAVGMFGFAFFNTVVWAFVTDVIDYHEYLTDLREDGTVYSIYSFARKVGQAIAGGIGGFAIAAVGYDATQEVQSQRTLDGIYTLATLVPGIVYIVIFLILVFLYPLTKQRLNQLTTDLAEKRQNKN